MITEKEKSRITELCDIIRERIRDKHIICFKNMDKPLFLISDTYPGVWLEHTYDAIMYAKICDEGKKIAENTINLFLDYQTDEGQLPCYVWNGDIVSENENIVGYSQIQECVSFTKLAYIAYEMTDNKELLEKAYVGCVAWNNWLTKYRMTRGKGLIEMFVGYDTGHDESARLNGMIAPGNYIKDGICQNAAVLPSGDDVVPIIACDMNANFYASKIYLSKMAEKLGKTDEAKKWICEAEIVKKKLFEICYDDHDKFFYDVDRHDNKRKNKSCTVFHMFMEGILKPGEDLTEEIYNRHIKNPEEFWTQYPFPSMAINDPAWIKRTPKNCWGYFSQALITLRATMWMDDYGKTEDLMHVMEVWLKAWTKHYDRIKFAQELDPITGVPSSSSEWYSSCMLFYLYSAIRFGIIDY